MKSTIDFVPDSTWLIGETCRILYKTADWGGLKLIVPHRLSRSVSGALSLLARKYDLGPGTF